MWCCTLSEVVVKSLECVADEWEAEFGGLLNDGRIPSSNSLGSEQRCVIRLIDFVRRKVGSINGGGESGFEGGSYSPEAVKFDATEKGVVLDLMGPATSEAVLGITDQAGGVVSRGERFEERGIGCSVE